MNKLQTIIRAIWRPQAQANFSSEYSDWRKQRGKAKSFRCFRMNSLPWLHICRVKNNLRRHSQNVRCTMRVQGFSPDFFPIPLHHLERTSFWLCHPRVLPKSSSESTYTVNENILIHCCFFVCPWTITRYTCGLNIGAHRRLTRENESARTPTQPPQKREVRGKRGKFCELFRRNRKPIDVNSPGELFLRAR